MRSTLEVGLVKPSGFLGLGDVGLPRGRVGGGGDDVEADDEQEHHRDLHAAGTMGRRAIECSCRRVRLVIDLDCSSLCLVMSLVAS